MNKSQRTPLILCILATLSLSAVDAAHHPNPDTTDKGLVTCIEAKSGEVRYEGGRVPVPATFTASPVAFEDMILLTSEDGDTFRLKAGPSHQILRTNSVGEPAFASPAISQGNIFIRGEKHLFCIGTLP